MVDILLSSTSPRRVELLQQIGVRFDVIRCPIVEAREDLETAEAYVQRLALEKAAAGFERQGASQRPLPVLGADTLGLLDDKVLEKPESREAAADMLRAMSGRTHRVLSAVALHCENWQRVRLSVTEVTFRPVRSQEIERYWATGEPCDKAGGYAIQGLASVFVERINGSYSGVVGLPLKETCDLLGEAGVPYWSAEKI